MAPNVVRNKKKSQWLSYNQYHSLALDKKKNEKQVQQAEY